MNKLWTDNCHGKRLIERTERSAVFGGYGCAWVAPLKRDVGYVPFTRDFNNQFNIFEVYGPIFKYGHISSFFRYTLSLVD